MQIAQLKNQKELLENTCTLLKEKIQEQREYNKISLKQKLELINQVDEHERRIKQIERRINDQ